MRSKMVPSVHIIMQIEIYDFFALQGRVFNYFTLFSVFVIIIHDCHHGIVGVFHFLWAALFPLFCIEHACNVVKNETSKTFKASPQ